MFDLGLCCNTVGLQIHSQPLLVPEFSWLPHCTDFLDVCTCEPMYQCKLFTTQRNLRGAFNQYIAGVTHGCFMPVCGCHPYLLGICVCVCVCVCVCRLGSCCHHQYSSCLLPTPQHQPLLCFKYYATGSCCPGRPCSTVYEALVGNVVRNRAAYCG